MAWIFPALQENSVPQDLHKLHSQGLEKKKNDLLAYPLDQQLSVFLSALGNSKFIFVVFIW